MLTKLSKYCDGIMEAAWLCAIVAIPTFFNVYSSRIFEPDKLTLLRSLALMILAAWIVKLLEGGRILWDRLQPDGSPLKAIFRLPLIAPVTALAVVYILSTIFSVTPRTSFWGSYQRLQGTYTTFSYLVIFAAMIGNLRRRVQVERIITVAILTSLPISLYGILQRYKIDPVPWGGDVSNRIAANMGNSIFVAAFLIMALPLTIGRIVDAFRSILYEQRGVVVNTVRATIYVFIMALQLIAIYFSGSRGPWLGMFVGIFFLLMLWTVLLRNRKLTIGIVVTTLVLGVTLVVFNIPNGPLERFRSQRGLGRLGQILSAESRTGQVRVLIWKGAAQLVAPHKPLEFPNGSKDIYNFLRPLIGYGPESMYVAYNPFYPTDLGHVEKRNASPDRSHNETWDSLVMTGVLGLGVYLWLFGTVFYFGLKWLGLIDGPKKRNLFIGLFIGGGVASAIFFVAWRGIAYLGVALPFGSIIGLCAYLALVALFGKYEAPRSVGDIARALTLSMLLAAIVSHFGEINFGIAIAATRTYFWVFTAMLILAGYILPKHGAYGLDGVKESQPEPVAMSQAAVSKISKSKRLRREREAKSIFTRKRGAAWFSEALIGGGMVALLMGILGYDFISNSNRLSSVSKTIINSVTRLPNKNDAYSLGVFALIITVWVMAVLTFVSENEHAKDPKSWWSAFLVTLGISGLIALLFWFWHASRLSTAIQDVKTLDQLEALMTGWLTNFYVYVFLLMLGLAFFLPESWPVKVANPSHIGTVIAPVALILALVLINYTNLRIIHADIVFKMADPYNKTGLWPNATRLYKEAIKLAPDEDYYYLFLGRSYLEQAKEEKEPDQLIIEAAKDLHKAQSINPLNTDHTANLARLFTWWAGRSADTKTRMERANQASEYYSRAVVLSPNNPNLWIEWSQLYLDVFKQTEKGYETLKHALDLDPQYSLSEGLMGDYYLRISQTITDTVARNQNLELAAKYYTEAERVATSSETQTTIGFLFSLGNVYRVLNKLDLAIQALEDGIKLKPKTTDLYKFELSLADLYYQQKDNANALIHAQNALVNASDNQKKSVEEFISKLQTNP
jgi:tetratricopeptide (TPR) repeat protein/O-antigen ligase